MNHRWHGNNYIRCGITRERKERRTFVRSYSVLNRQGVFMDRDIFRDDMAWWYGKEHQFKRPDCKKAKISVRARWNGAGIVQN